MEPPDAQRARERQARWLLSPLFAAVLLAVVAAPGRAPLSVDNRTYFEMMDGIARHGLPYTENGPVDRFPELQARWNRFHGGRLWGTYPPVFPYLAAPLYRWGGTAAVVRLDIALLGLLALALHSLGRRVTRDPLLGALAAYTGVGAIPMATVAFDVSSYMTSIVFMVYAVDHALAAAETPGGGRWRWFAAGLCGGLSTGAHLLAFPMLAALVGTAATLEPARAASAAAAPERSRLRDASLRALAVAAGAVPPLWAVGVLNRARFDGWNPITYGPCVWRSCAETGLDRQGLMKVVIFAAPAIAWAALVALLFWQRLRLGIHHMAVVAAGALALVPSSLVRERVLAIFAVGWYFVVDASRAPMQPWFWRPADGLGNFLGPYAVKSLLQCTPLLVLALLARPVVTRPALRLLGWPSAALVASLALRADLPAAFALAFPFLDFRYLLPAAPLLGVLAVAVAGSWRWRRAEILVALLVAVAFGLWLSFGGSDEPHFRRFLLLRGTLLLAAVALGLGLAARLRAHPGWRRAAALVAAVALGLGVAVSAGVDVVALVRIRRDGDRRLDRIARLTPARFALVAWPPELDPALGLRASRDIEYLDLYEVADRRHIDPLIEHWDRERRPIYGLFARPPAPSPLGEHARFELIDREVGLYRLIRQ